MLTESERLQYQNDGYFIREGLFSVEEMDGLAQILDKFEAQRAIQVANNNNKLGISRANEITFLNQVSDHEVNLKKFCAQPKLVSFALDLVGPDLTLHSDQLVYKKPEAPRDFPWHQDSGYRVVDPLDHLICWIAVTDATVENGTISVLPRSHKQGLAEHRPTELGKQCYFGDDPGIPATVGKGGVAFFSSLLFHKSGPNTSHSTRKAYIVRYTPAHVRDVATGEIINRTPMAKDGVPVVY
jgi:ectoine hydroxylase-related dioxygenase (phytanoyl-CoA dioxygenase family)